MSTYTVQSNLNHDGKEYKAGDTVELDEEVGKRLVADGVVAEMKVKKPAPPANLPVAPKGTANPLESLSYKDLQERAAALGIPAVGVSKKELIERISEAEAAANKKESGDEDAGNES